ncbi:MAG: DUF4167 domain-containing protein [Alphaproteobacteria bacterium]|nr:DUF4167 domain-containing protein [Alphaproteobacteria bacterium]
MIRNDKRNQTPHHFMNNPQQTAAGPQQMSSPSYPNGQHNTQHRDQPNTPYQNNGHYQSTGQQTNQHQNNGHYPKQQMSNPRRPMSRQSGQGPTVNSGTTRSHQSLRNQNIDSSGPDVRIRGTIYQIFEKYAALARDATLSGDRVLAENLLQHGEHYMRLVNEINAEIASEPRQNFQYQNQMQPQIQPQIQPAMQFQQPSIHQPPMQPIMQQPSIHQPPMQPMMQQPSIQQPPMPPITQQPSMQQPPIQPIMQQPSTQPSPQQPQFLQPQTKLRVQRPQMAPQPQPIITEEEKVKFQSPPFEQPF